MINNLNKTMNTTPLPRLITAFLLFTFLFLGNITAKEPQDETTAELDLLIQQKNFDQLETRGIQLALKGKPQYYLYIIDYYLDQGEYPRAQNYSSKLVPKDPSDNELLYLRKGRASLGLGNYNEALAYLDKTQTSIYLALTYEKLASEALQKNDLPSARNNFSNAIDVYEVLLTDFHFKWNPSYFAYFKKCLELSDRIEKTGDQKDYYTLLSNTLDGAAKYCEKMKNSAFHFFCKEKIYEVFDQENPYSSSRSPAKIGRSSYVYEYQLIQEENENNKIYETRTLLELNGNKKNVPNSKLEIIGCHYERLIFSPINLFLNPNQPFYFYKIVKEETLWDEPAIVIEVLPLTSNPELYGNVWISKKDYSIMKIQWTPKSIQKSYIIEEQAREFDSEPQITFFAEFKTQKRGIRFPSHYYFNEIYARKNRSNYNRLVLNVDFSDYLFFVVGSEVTEAKADTTGNSSGD